MVILVSSTLSGTVSRTTVVSVLLSSLKPGAPGSDRFALARDRAELLVDEGLGLLRVEVSGEHERRVRGVVPGREELLHVGHGRSLEVFGCEPMTG